MTIKIIIPTPLRPSVDQQTELNIEFAGSVQQLVEQMISTYPKLKPYLISDDGALRKFINFYVNDVDIRDLEQENTALKSDDTLSIVPAIAGGYC
tara:strand:+ start:336 stop:620 length:285 start_codon:yes stop_codon:yes gene_type:complete